MRLKRKPAPVIVRETTYFRVFHGIDARGADVTEVRQLVIIRDEDGVLRRAYRRDNV